TLHFGSQNYRRHDVGRLYPRAKQIEDAFECSFPTRERARSLNLVILLLKITVANFLRRVVQGICWFNSRSSRRTGSTCARLRVVRPSEIWTSRWPVWRPTIKRTEKRWHCCRSPDLLPPEGYMRSVIIVPL